VTDDTVKLAIVGKVRDPSGFSSRLALAATTGACLQGTRNVYTWALTRGAVRVAAGAHV
jgi:hypothetical protein